MYGTQFVGLVNMNGKPKVKLYDKIFAHVKLMSNKNLDFEIPFEWYRGGETQKVAVFTDFSLDEVDLCDSEIKIAMLMESPEIFPAAYNKIFSINSKFDKVLTFDKRLLDLGENFCNYRLGGTWIKESDWAVYHKTKDTSMISSGKKTTTGQQLRLKIIDKIKNEWKDFPPTKNLQIDIYGREENPIEYKLDGLKDYRFSIAIENCQKNFYFTEKLLDCFLTGTLPIYYGCTDFKTEYLLKTLDFDMKGILFLKDIDNLRAWFEVIHSEEFYNKRKESIIRNFFRAKLYATPEFQIWDYLKRYYE